MTLETTGSSNAAGLLVRLLDAERNRLGSSRVLELLSLLVGDRVLVGDAARYVFEYGRRAGYDLPAYPLDGSGEFREFFADEGVRNVPEWYERKLGVPATLYADLPERTLVVARDAGNRRAAFVLDAVRHAHDKGYATLADSGLARTLAPGALDDVLGVVMAFLLGERLDEGAREGVVRFVSRAF